MHQDRRGYWYACRKVNGRVERDYVGRGPLADLWRRADELTRRRREQEAEAFQTWKAELDALAADAAGQDGLTDLLVRAAILLAGWRPHHRQWRRSKSVDLPPDVAEALNGMTFEDVHAVIRRAEEGDRAALPKLRVMLQIPGFMALLHGDVVRAVRSTFARRINEKNLLQIETTLRQCELLAEELAGPHAPPLERLLCERIATAHLHLHVLEAEFAARGMSLEMAAHLQRAISQAQRRYLQAVKTLAMVRRMGAASSLTMQLNVGAQQVNVAGGAAALPVPSPAAIPLPLPQRPRTARAANRPKGAKTRKADAPDRPGV